MKDGNFLYYDHKAKNFNEALPLGNGKIGAMIYGDPEKEKVSLNYDELWTGYPRDYTDMCKYKNFDRARVLALQGKYYEAENILESSFEGLNSEAYMPFGDLTVDTGSGKVREYRRCLDLETGVHTVEFKKSGVSFKEESFVSAPDNVFVLNIEADSVFNSKIKLSSPLKSEIKTIGYDYILDGQCPSYSPNNKKFFKYDMDLYSDNDKEKGMLFRGAVRIKTDGRPKFKSDDIHIKNAKKIIIYFAVESSYNGYKRHPYLDGKDYENPPLETLEKVYNKTYEEVKECHVKDFTAFYDRTELFLGTDYKDNVPLDKRLASFSGKNDVGLFTLLFNFGKYLTISSSRQGSEATNLQGIWNDSVNPPWASNYTVNINTEMNYFPTMEMALPEMKKPLIELVKKIADTGEKTADKCYHARGFCAHHNVDIWGLSTPVQGKSQWSFWYMSGAWFCHDLYEYYEYTLDKDYLSKTAYPIMEKAALFLLDMLIIDKDGYYIICPSTSPENKFFWHGRQVDVSETSTMTMSITRELFRNVLKASEVLGIKDNVTEEIRAKIDKLLPYKFNSTGDLMEFYDEVKYPEPEHRHVSHLYGLFPSNLIDYDKTPELCEAVKKSLEFRGDDGTGWSIAWKANLYAKLRDGNHAKKLLTLQLKPIGNRYVKGLNSGKTYPNFFNSCPPFQIDGNFGAASAVEEMLMQSDGEKIILLPALPDDWTSGYVKGLAARGNVTVDITWKDKKLTGYKINGDLRDIKIIYNGKCMN